VAAARARAAANKPPKNKRDLAARQNDQFPKLLFRETDKPIAVVNGNKKHGCTSFEKKRSTNTNAHPSNLRKKFWKINSRFSARFLVK
jgi:hypothetical protein